MFRGRGHSQSVLEGLLTDFQASMRLKLFKGLPI